MAPPYPVVIFSETPNGEGFGECTETFYLEVCRCRSVSSVSASEGAACLGAKECIAHGGGVERPCGMECHKNEKSPRRHCRSWRSWFCWPTGSRGFEFGESARNPYFRSLAVFMGAAGLGLRECIASGCGARSLWFGIRDLKEGCFLLVAGLRVESMKKERKKTRH